MPDKIRDKTDILVLLAAMILDAERREAFPLLCRLITIRDWIISEDSGRKV